MLAPIAFLLGFFAVASAYASASPGVARLPITVRKGAAGKGFVGLVAADRARVAQIKADVKHGHRRRDVSSVNATNAVVQYTVDVDVGGVTRALIVDTGSANSWVGALLPYNGTNCKGLFKVTYGSAYVSGKEERSCTDNFVFSPDLVVANQTFGVAAFAHGWSADGILGIGPPGLTAGTANAEYIVPTVTNNLYKQGKIAIAAVGIAFAPATSESVTNGVLTFGGADATLYVGNLSYTPLTTVSPASKYWGVAQTVSYGNTTIMPLASGIVDTGTTLIYLPTDTYTAYVAATGATYDNTTGLLTITEEQYATLGPLTFDLGAAGTAVLSANAQIWPRALNTAIGGNANAIYVVVADIGELSVSGLDFMLGYAFLERFYTMYDATNARFGIAQTEFTNATTN